MKQRLESYIKRGFSMRQIIKAEHIDHKTLISLLNRFGLVPRYSDVYAKDIREMIERGETINYVVSQLPLCRTTIWTIMKKNNIKKKYHKPEKPVSQTA